MSKKIAVLVGSLRKESFSRKIAHALISRAPDSLECRIVEIGELALYNEDLDQASPPAAWVRFREEMKAIDGVLFVTPEYNRSIPGCLKNAIDVGSRPYGKSVFQGLPAAVVSSSPSQYGGFGANHVLRQSFVFLDLKVMQQPEAYLGKVGESLDGQGKIKDPKTGELLEKFMGSFARWVAQIRGGVEGPVDLGEFMRKREKAAQDYVNGDARALGAMATTQNPATFFPPRGPWQQGASAVSERYVKDAEAFKAGGTTKLEVLQSRASGDLAFWTGFQRAEVRMGKEGAEPVSMLLRITEVFRLEEGEYRLVHRHADAGEGSK